MRWPVQVQVRVREKDCCDGVADEASMLVYFREARRAYIGLLNALHDDFRCRLWDARLKVHRHVCPGEDLAVRVSCDEMGEASFRMRYLVRDRGSDETVAEGSSVHVLINETGQDEALPEVFRKRVIALEGRSFPRPS